MVIARVAGTVSTMADLSAFITATRIVPNCGRNFDTGSSIRIRPCSYNISAPDATIGLVIDAMLKIASVVIGVPAALSV